MRRLYIFLTTYCIVDAYISFKMSSPKSCPVPNFWDRDAAEDCCVDVEPPDTDYNQVGGELVLYQPTFLEPFKLKQRTFKFAGREIVITQNWESVGVAAVVWDAAIVLSEYAETMVNNGQLSLKNKKVIELGAGTGLVGIVAAVLGGHVTLTDRQLALECLKENARINEEALDSEPDFGQIEVKELEWGKALKLYAEAFDVIFGADIVYIEDTFTDLLATLIHLSSLPADSRHTVIYLSCRIRYEKDRTFLDTLKKHFDVNEVHHDLLRGIKIYKAMALQ